MRLFHTSKDLLLLWNDEKLWILNTLLEPSMRPWSVSYFWFKLPSSWAFCWTMPILARVLRNFFRTDFARANLRSRQNGHRRWFLSQKRYSADLAQGTSSTQWVDLTEWHSISGGDSSPKQNNCFCSPTRASKSCTKFSVFCRTDTAIIAVMVLIEQSEVPSHFRERQIRFRSSSSSIEYLAKESHQGLSETLKTERISWS